MAHPNRRVLRERKRKKKEKMLGRKNAFDVLDLTPYNAMGKMTFKQYELKLK